MDQAAPIYIPPSKSTRHILPVPQKPGQGDYHYGMPGQASPIYIPPSSHTATSDVHSKREIERLSAQNDSLTKALSGATGAPSGSMPTESYPMLPTSTKFQPAQASRASFEDAPGSPANTVAAQNVGIQAMQPQPQPQAPTASQAPSPFGFKPPPVDLSELDEAYRRPGTTPGA